MADREAKHGRQRSQTWQIEELSMALRGAKYGTYKNQVYKWRQKKRDKRNNPNLSE